MAISVSIPKGLLCGAPCRPFYPAHFGSPCDPHSCSPLPVSAPASAPPPSFPLPWGFCLALATPVLRSRHLTPSLIPYSDQTRAQETLWRGPTGSSSIRGPGRSDVLFMVSAPAAFSRPVLDWKVLSFSFPCAHPIGRHLPPPPPHLCCPCCVGPFCVYFGGRPASVMWCFCGLVFFPSTLHARTTPQHFSSVAAAPLLSLPCSSCPRKAVPMAFPGHTRWAAHPYISPSLLPALRRLLLRVSCPPPPLLFLAGLVCVALILSVPQLYLSRPHAHLRRQPISLTVGRLGRPPRVPLWGNSPVVPPRRPPLHQLSDGEAERLLRLNGAPWPVVVLQVMWCPCLFPIAPSALPFAWSIVCSASSPAPFPSWVACSLPLARTPRLSPAAYLDGPACCPKSSLPSSLSHSCPLRSSRPYPVDLFSGLVAGPDQINGVLLNLKQFCLLNPAIPCALVPPPISSSALRARGSPACAGQSTSLLPCVAAAAPAPLEHALNQDTGGQCDGLVPLIHQIRHLQPVPSGADPRCVVPGLRRGP